MQGREIKVKTVNFDSATIAGEEYDLRDGRLTVRWEPSGRYAWDASAKLAGVSRGLNQLTNGDAADVSFETKHHGTFSGKAYIETSVAVNTTGSATLLRLHGTGDLDGIEQISGT